MVKASFMNMVLGFTADGTTKEGGGFRKDGTGSYVVLEIREGDDINSGFVKGIQINGTRKTMPPIRRQTAGSLPVRV